MIKNVHISTMAPGATTGFKIRVQQHLANVKGILLTGQNVELTGASVIDQNLVFSSIGAANNRISPNKRIIPLVRKFAAGDELRFTLRNHHTASQQVTVNLITG